MTVVGSDDHEHDCADAESAASAVSAARSPPPPGATQLEDVTHSLGAALGLDPVPRSGSGVDDEANLDHMDSTFLGHFERDLGVLHVVDMTIHDGVRPHGGPVPEVGGPVRVSRVCQRRCRGACRGGLQRKVRSFGRRGQRW